MPDETVPTTAITLQLHTETIDRVEAHELEPPAVRVVAVTFGDDQSGLHLIGDEHDFACRVIHGLTADEAAELAEPTGRPVTERLARKLFG